MFVGVVFAVRGGNVYAEWFALPHAILARWVDVVVAKARIGRSVRLIDVCGGVGVILSGHLLERWSESTKFLWGGVT